MNHIIHELKQPDKKKKQFYQILLAGDGSNHNNGLDDIVSGVDGLEPFGTNRSSLVGTGLQIDTC